MTKNRKRKKISSPNRDEEVADKHWHLSRSIPITFVASGLIYCLAHVCLFGWYASQVNFRVGNLETFQIKLIPQLEKSQIQFSNQGERLTRLEEKMGTIQSGVTDLKTDLKGMSQTLSSLSGKTIK